MDLSNSQSKKLRSQCDGSCSSNTDSSDTSRRSVHQHHHHSRHVNELHCTQSSFSSSATFSLQQHGITREVQVNNGGISSEQQMIRRNFRNFSSSNSNASPSLNFHQGVFNVNHRDQREIQSGDAAMNLSCHEEKEVANDGCGLDTDSSEDTGEEVFMTTKIIQRIRTDQEVSRQSLVHRGINLVQSLILHFLIIVYKIAMLLTTADYWILSRIGNFYSVQLLRKYWDLFVILLIMLPILYFLMQTDFVQTAGLKEVASPFFALLNSSSPFFTSIAHLSLHTFYSQSQKSVQKEEVQGNPSALSQIDHSSSEAQKVQFILEDPHSLTRVQEELERLRSDMDKLFRLFEEQKLLTKEKESGDSIAERMRLLEDAVLLLKSQLSLSSKQTEQKKEESEEEREKKIRAILLNLWEDEGEEKIVARLKKIFISKDEFLSFISLTLELKQTVIDLKTAKTEIRSEVTYSEEELLLVVRRELALYDADKLGLVDYALESSGGSVISTRCSETYTRYSPQIYVWGLPVWKEAASPRLVIQPGRQPGECWPFVGSEGYLVIQLSRPIIPTAFSLDHVPSSISPGNSVRSAPKNFSVWGLKSEMDPGLLFGEYVYDDRGNPLQTFPVEAKNSEAFNLIEFKIHSNHGHPEFTCVYRFRVHGVPEDA